MNLTRLESTEQLTQRGVEMFVTAMKEAIAERGRFLVALSGGNTPRPVYEALAKEPYGHKLAWESCEIFFGDERMVTSDNPESNFHMACDALLDHIAIPPSNIHRIEGEMQPDVAARWYSRTLSGFAEAGGLPRFDLMLLGLGPDGHTASLFPRTDALNNLHDLAVPVHLPEDSAGAKHAQDRVTLTFPVINASRRIVFLVSGDDKKEALERVKRGDQTAPAARVQPTDGELFWLVVED
jgi:6-phosphogluconolactonase